VPPAGKIPSSTEQLQLVDTNGAGEGREGGGAEEGREEGGAEGGDAEDDAIDAVIKTLLHTVAVRVEVPPGGKIPSCTVQAREFDTNIGEGEPVRTVLPLPVAVVVVRTVVVSSSHQGSSELGIGACGWPSVIC